MLLKKFTALLLLLTSATNVLAVELPVPQQEKVFKNYLTNPGFENGSYGWTASGGATKAAAGAALGEGAAGYDWNSNGAAQTLTSNSITIPAGLKGKNGLGYCNIKTVSGTATHTIQVDDGINLLATAQTVVSSTSQFVKQPINFIFPSSGTVRIKLISIAADEPEIYIDSCYLGEASNLTSVSQATIYGGDQWVGVSSCNWTTTSTSFGNFSADSDCTNPTGSNLYGNATAPATKVPGVTFATIPPGEYEVEALFTGEDTTAANAYGCVFRLHDGTTAGLGSAGSWINATNQLQTPYALTSRFTYTTTQSNVTFQVQGVSENASNTCTLFNGTTNNNVSFIVKRFPTTSETAYLASAGGLSSGDVVATAAPSCPLGTIAADGSSLLRTDYPALFSAIGTTYGAADGTHFTVPDARGVFMRGAGTQSISGTSYTGTQGTSQQDNFQGHYHDGAVIQNTSAGSFSATGAYVVLSSSGSASSNRPVVITTTGAITDGSNGTPRTGTETRPANISVKYCVRTIAATPTPSFVGSIKGTSTNDDPAIGYIGEVLSFVNSTATNVPGASTNFANTTCTISITPGDWMLGGQIDFTNNGATVQAVRMAVDTSGGSGVRGSTQLNGPATTSSADSSLSVLPFRLSLAATTSYYVVAAAQYSAGTPQYYCRITATRIR